MGPENHPIPQDITGFEFKLIGDMTLKQFAYLASGGILGWILYSIVPNIILKLIFFAIPLGIGAAFAFLPIDGRPLDVMIINFFKAVFSPTKYYYLKLDDKVSDPSKINEFNKSRLSISDMSEKQLSDFLEALPKGKNKLDKKEMVFFQSLNQYGTAASAQATPGYVAEHAYADKGVSQAQNAQPQPVLNINPNDYKTADKDGDLQKTAALLEKELQAAKAREAQQPQVNSQEYLDAHQKVLELQKNLNDLLFQKQQLEEKLISLQKTMENQGKPVYSATMATPDAIKETKNVRSIPQNMAQSVGLPSTPEFPNIITGIVKDPRGNPLSNILVEVKDTQGNAVRAFKTNALGQFMSATPLTNGNYSIEFEDPRGQNKFDSVVFGASGEIILPIEVLSVDTREELRRSLFN
ncbi:MAG TPA: PrgI family protein [Candidatus Sulfotelmatobacter sp.]|nr:PrgI family protein [Candidatus Sulfotelmatobacter sp.]